MRSHILHRLTIILILLVLSACSGGSDSSDTRLMGGTVQGNSLVLARSVTTFAGSPPATRDGIGREARFNRVAHIATDGVNLYLSDGRDHVIRKVVIATGAVTTIAGSAGSSGAIDGTGAAALFNGPSGIVVVGESLYVSDSGNNTIRRIDLATGTVTTFAGMAGVNGTADGRGTAARFGSPGGMATDGTNLYVADSNHTIRRITIAAADVTTLAGAAGLAGTADGIGPAARFGTLGQMVTDGTYLYVCHWNTSTPFQYAIRKVTIATGTVTTLATSTNIDLRGIALEGETLYLSDMDGVQSYDIASGRLTALAGHGALGFSDGTGTAARFSFPSGLVASNGRLYVADTNNCALRTVVIATRGVTTLAGAGTTGWQDGVGQEARFYHPRMLTTDGPNLYVVDTSNHSIRKIVVATGAVSTLAGTPGVPGIADGIGPAAGFAGPEGVSTDGRRLYIADTGNCTIRSMELATLEVITLAGTSGDCTSRDGVGTAARFFLPRDITTDGSSLFVVDGHAIRKIDITTKVVTTLAGIPGLAGADDGLGVAARFDTPGGITTDGTSLFVADAGNRAIRKVVIATGEVSTIADTTFPNQSSLNRLRGRGGMVGRPPVDPPPIVSPPYTGDSPLAITTDGFDLYFTSWGMVRKVELATGTVSTVAGVSSTGSRDGVGTDARIGFPGGITTDGRRLFMSDSSNSAIRVIE